MKAELLSLQCHFRNHSIMPIFCSRNISHCSQFYFCRNWKVWAK